MSDALPQTEEQQDDPLTPVPQSQGRRFRFLGLVLIAMALILGVYLLVGYLAWQSGQTLLVEKQETQLSAQISRQLSLARQNLDEGSLNLAARRLEWILQRVPDHEEATALLALTQQTGDEPPIQEIIVATATPTPAPLPTPTPGEITNPLTELQRLRLLIAKEEWSNAISGVLTFQRQFPNYERRETNRLLYDGYVNLGLVLIEGEQAELGLFYLNQAEELGDLPQEVIDYRTWAEWYLQGIAFFGANWSISVNYFRDLCLVAPFYQSSCALLAEALIGYADQYAFSQDWCPAQELYNEARIHQGNSASLAEKLTAAQTGCAAATPTPAPITGTLPITNVFPATRPFFPVPSPTPVSGPRN